MKRIHIFLIAAFAIVPTATHAQNFLVGIPGVNQGSEGGFDAYIQAVYVMFISIAALLAVVKIIIAGLKYMFTDIVTQKGEAKKDIQGAVFGLIIVLAAVLILTIINPELTNFEVNQNRVSIPAAQQQSYDELSGFDQYCQANGGNCELRSCNALDDYTEEMILAGATVGLIAPGIGSMVGIAVGGAAGFVLNYAGTETECAVVCSWLSGEVTQLNGQSTCQFPQDALAAKQAILEARQQELAEIHDCEDGRLIMLGGEFSNCIRDVESEEAEEILSALGVSSNSNLAESIISRVENFALQTLLVDDQNQINQLTNAVGASRLALSIEIPSNTNITDRTNIETNFAGICTDSGFDHDQITIGSRDFMVCGE